MADPISATFAAIAAAATSATVAVTGSAALAAAIGNAILSAGAFLASFNGALLAANIAAAILLSPNVNVEGSPTEWRPDANAGIPVVIGRAATAGSIIHMDEHGPDNRYLTIENLLSAGPIDAIESFQADRVAVSFSGTGATSPSDYASKMWLSTSLGSKSQSTAISIGALPHGDPSLAGWGSGSILPGLAHTLWTLYQDSKFKSYPQGAPDPLHIIRGVKVYDPRKDSTYPGGSGSHRLDDPDTWEFSKNPGLHAIAWSLGHTFTDPNTDKVFRVGIGCSASGIHWPAFVELANVCDANDWEVSAVPTSSDDKHQVLKAILQAGGARYASLAGKVSCIARTPRTSVATVSVADTAGPFEIDVNADRLTRRNTITPRCVQEDHDWQMTPQDAVTVAEYVTADGGSLPQSLDFPYVAVAPASTNKDQPRQLAAYAMLDSRESIVGTVPFRPHMAQVEPGDIFTVDEPGYLLDGVELLCLQRTIDAANNVVQLTFVSESDGKHDYALGRTNTPPTPPGLTAPDIRDVPPPVVGDFNPSVPPNRKTPTIRVDIPEPPETPNPGQIILIRPPNDPGTGSAWENPQAGWEMVSPQLDVSVTSWEITGLEPNTAYEVGILYVSQFGIFSPVTSLGTYTTGDLVADAVGDFDYERIAALIDELLSAVKTQELASVRAMIDEARARQGVDRKAVNLFTTEREERITADTAVLEFTTTQISAVDEAIAGIETYTATLASDLEAETTNRTTQFSALNNSVATLSSQYSTLASDVSSQASIVTGLSATVGGLDSDVTALTTDVAAVQASVESLEATRLIGVQAGSGYAGVQFSARQSDGQASSDIRLAAQKFGFATSFEGKGFEIDAIDGYDRNYSASGTKTRENDWNTGHEQRWKPDGTLIWDTEQGGLLLAGLPNEATAQIGNRGSDNNVAASGWTAVASSSISGMHPVGIVMGSGYFGVETSAATVGSWRLRLTKSGSSETIASGQYQTHKPNPADPAYGSVDFSRAAATPFGGDCTLWLDVFASGTVVFGEVTLSRLPGS
ncbi:hypothetical protein [Marinicauda sp. Alg238-R41]|uniref:hypothetical protein n=1 Tax=Marinicauda sp. Alg238-R41 TaxID=2993447 RepID=UPI0022E10B8F|nr:hypothetical protein [Marinicauda sp. Alg238-R41]